MKYFLKTRLWELFFIANIPFAILPNAVFASGVDGAATVKVEWKQKLQDDWNAERDSFWSVDQPINVELRKELYAKMQKEEIERAVFVVISKESTKPMAKRLGVVPSKIAQQTVTYFSPRGIVNSDRDGKIKIKNIVVRDGFPYASLELRSGETIAIRENIRIFKILKFPTKLVDSPMNNIGQYMAFISGKLMQRTGRKELSIAWNARNSLKVNQKFSPQKKFRTLRLANWQYPADEKLANILKQYGLEEAYFYNPGLGARYFKLGGDGSEDDFIDLEKVEIKEDGFPYAQHVHIVNSGGTKSIKNTGVRVIAIDSYGKEIIDLNSARDVEFK